MTRETVLITDYAWPDLTIEREIVEGAGLRLVSGPADPQSVESIAKLVRLYQPASVMTCWAMVDSVAVNASTNLRHVGRIGVGLDNIDVGACTARAVPVTNVPDYCVEEVSDHVLAFTLAWARGICHFDRDVRSGNWRPASAMLRRVRDLTIGVVGFGKIGQATARKFSALGCRVVSHTRNAHASADGLTFLGLDELLAQSDVVILHIPLTPETRHLMDRARITQMKEGSLLVNVSRGAIVDTTAVVDALVSGRLSGAALDVLEAEPTVPSILLDQVSSLLTPHVAFSSTASLAELRRRASEEAVRVLGGRKPLHQCNLID
jgi:D-3-phosphoglycerate dehydrogenase / 2-oxoglutarate reductase